MFLEIFKNTFIVWFPMFCVGFITLPLTLKFANGNPYIQNIYISLLRFIYLFFAMLFLYFEKDIINFRSRVNLINFMREITNFRRVQSGNGTINVSRFRLRKPRPVKAELGCGGSKK